MKIDVPLKFMEAKKSQGDSSWLSTAKASILK